VTGTLRPNLVSVTPYEIASLPDWVRVDTRAISPAQNTESPQVFNLVDYQLSVNADSTASFSRLNFTILDASRIDEGSQFLYEVVPGSQQVVFHSCVIHRDGQTINALDADNIRAVQRERELEKQIASGRLTVELTVDDVRVGDTVDICVTEYDLAGEHPLYGRYFQATNWLSWGVPVARQTLLLRNNSPKSVQFREIDSEKSVDKRKEVAPGDTYTQEWSELPMRESTPGVPNWFWPPAYFVTSESSWESISSYLYNFYVKQGVLEDNIDLGSIEGIDWQGRNAETVNAVIDFVQNEVRYRGENNGIYSHTPKEPARTLKKRSGDCKDKSNLLLALLTRIDVDAQLVLVNTRLMGEIANLDPSPYLFDHMVVRFEFDGETYYVDPTLQKQGGSLANRTKLGYEQALILSPENGKLVAVPKQDSNDLFKLKHIVDLRDESKPRLTIKRVFHSERADNMRSYFASREKSQYQDDFEDYAKEHVNVSLERVSGIEIEKDDLLGNYLGTSETYALILDDGKLEGNSMQVFTSFYEQVQIYDERELPQVVELDGELLHHIHVMYPYKQTIDTDKFSKETQWFDYNDSIEVDGNNLHFKMKISPKADEVPADKNAEYQKVIEELQARSISRFPVKREKSDTELFVLFAAMIGLLAAYSHIPFALFAAGCATLALVGLREQLVALFKPKK